MGHGDAKSRSKRYLTALSGAALVLFGLGGAARAGDVTVPGSTDFPESMTGTADGTLYFSSFTGGRIFRAEPGARQASEWVKPGSLATVLGVLADAKSGTLYACSPDLAAMGFKTPGSGHGGTLALYDLKTGAAKASLPMPGNPTLCNDIAVAGDGTAYITDSLAGNILRLKPGAQALEIWVHDPRWVVEGKAQLDGIAVLPDGNVYANIFEGDGLYRIAVNSDGSAGAITKLRTSRPLYHSDGLRAYGPNRLVMVEGETKGNLDLITISGDEAQIETVKSGFEGPVSLWQVGETIYVLDVPLKYLFDPKMKTQRPPPFTAFAVPAPR